MPPVPYVYNRTYICFLFPCICSHTLMLSFTHIYPHLYAFLFPLYTHRYMPNAPHIYLHTNSLYAPCTNTYCFMCSFYQHIYDSFSPYIPTQYMLYVPHVPTCSHLLYLPHVPIQTCLLCIPTLNSFVCPMYLYKCTGICFKCPMKWFL